MPAAAGTQSRLWHWNAAAATDQQRTAEIVIEERAVAVRQQAGLQTAASEQDAPQQAALQRAAAKRVQRVQLQPPDPRAAHLRNPCREWRAWRNGSV